MPGHPAARDRPAILALLLLTATRNRASTFVAIFLAEILAWAGVPAIGAAAMGAGGALASQGVIHLWALLVVGTVGAEIGSFGGWWIGRKVARAGLKRPGRGSHRRAQALAAGARFADRWGRLVVFFVPSWVSGALGMPFRRFAVWNLLASFLWTLAAGLGAYGLGSAISGGELVDTVLPIAIAVAALAAILFLVTRHRRRRALIPHG
jgi:membrane protein DedA with SNARE-associated domain